MADAKPLKNKGGEPSQFETGDVVPAAHGGTGQASLAAALAALLATAGAGEEGQYLTPDGSGGFEWRPMDVKLVGDFEETFRTVPRDGFLDCDGAVLSQAMYPELYAAIGNNYAESSPSFTLATGGGASLQQQGGVATNGSGTWIVLHTSHSQYYLSTDDGRTFTTQTGPSTMFAIGYGNGLWLCSTGSTIYSSTTGLTSSWTSRHTGSSSYYNIQHNGSEFVVSGDNGAGTLNWARSANGTSSWSSSTHSANLYLVRDQIWFNSLWLYASSNSSGTASIVSAAANSTTFTTRLSQVTPFSSAACSFAKNTAGTVCVCMIGEKLYSSANGTAWTSRTLPGATIYTSAGSRTRVFWDAYSSQFVAMALTTGSSNTLTGIWTSSDGATWVLVDTTSLASGGLVGSLRSSAGTTVLAGGDSNIYYRFRTHDFATAFILPNASPNGDGASVHIKAEE